MLLNTYNEFCQLPNMHLNVKQEEKGKQWQLKFRCDNEMRCSRVRENIARRGNFGSEQLIRSLLDWKVPLQIWNYKNMLESCQLTVTTDQLQEWP